MIKLLKKKNSSQEKDQNLQSLNVSIKPTLTLNVKFPKISRCVKYSLEDCFLEEEQLRKVERWLENTGHSLLPYLKGKSFKIKF